MKYLQKSATLGGFASVLAMSLYLSAVILTTPALPPQASVYIALSTNGSLIVPLVVALGVQTALSAYAKHVRCHIRKARVSVGTGISGTLLSGIFSFFALVPVGCCGLIFYWISLLPSIVGLGATVFMLEYSNILAISGLAATVLSAIYLGLEIRRARVSYGL